MPDVQDLSTLGQNKDKQILNLKLPMPSDKPITSKEFSDYCIYNFDQVGRVLLGILDFMKGQNNVNEVYKRELDTINQILDAWIKEAKKLEEKDKPV
ncbi:MAG: hypothetical protein PHG69_06300 [Candidatus Omnitrophica bacterium]|nr:hypothetical protein [Candidatus Omnitrophota bacterium]